MTVNRSNRGMVLYCSNRRIVVDCSNKGIVVDCSNRGMTANRSNRGMLVDYSNRGDRDNWYHSGGTFQIFDNVDFLLTNGPLDEGWFVISSFN